MFLINNQVLTTADHFPDNTLHLKLPILQDDIVNVHWQYEDDSELFTLICIKNFYEKYLVNLYMPYIPHARMDRVENSGDVFTLKYFCKVINDLNFYRVFVLDPHSNVSLALLDRVETLDVFKIIQQTIKYHEATHNSNTAIFFPDEGAMKRYSKQIARPYAFGIKKRDWETGEIKGLSLVNKENIVDKDVLIIDDICSRGGTFVHSAKALLEAGAKSVSLYVTHCENTVLDGELLKKGLVNMIFTTNSLKHKPELQKHLIYI